MAVQDIKERIRVLSGGSRDKAVLVGVANQIKEEGWNPRAILKAVREETGVGLSLRTTFKRGEKTFGESMQVSKASKVVERRVQDEVVAEAKERIEEVLSVGKTIIDQLAQLACFHGYAKVDDFIWTLYNFWDLYHDYVPKQEEENKLLNRAVDELIKRFSPEAKRILLHNKMSELLQSFTWLSMVTGNFPPPLYLYGIRKILASILYDELEFETSTEKVKLGN